MSDLVGGVAPTALQFGKYLKKDPKCLPQGSVADTGDDPGEYTGDQYKTPTRSECHVWAAGSDPGDLRGHRGDVRPAAG